MKKKTIAFVAALLVGLPLFAQSPTTAVEDARKFTRQELAQMPRNLVDPLGVTKPMFMPMDWVDAQNLLVMQYNTETAKYDLMVYNTRKGTYRPYVAPETAQTTAPAVEIEGENLTYSPDSTMIAFTRNHNLFVYEVATGIEKQYTFDGNELILNGKASWVYYEEILGRPSKYRAFWWSPDSKSIAFYRFDNSQVPMFPIYDAKGQHGTLTETRYPKAGDTNPGVRVGFVEIGNLKSRDLPVAVWADFNEADDQYFGIPYWSGDSQRFIVPWMPREQNEMFIYQVDPKQGTKSPIYEETQPTWIDWVTEGHFTGEGMYMVRDFSLWEQIYYVPYDGSAPVKQLTTGKNWNIRILKVDEKAGLLFYSANCDSPVRRDVYKVDMKNQKTEKISFGPYNFETVLISPDNKQYVAVYNNAQTPSILSLVVPGRKMKVVELDNAKGPNFDQYRVALPELVSITTGDGYELPGLMTLPLDMDPNKKYPVIVSIYGGPNSPQVFDRWKNPSFANQWWANEGIIQITVDCRAGGHNGKEALNHIFRQLGVVELQDFIEWAKYLRSLPFVDGNKIGITGFSFGGTMTVQALTAGADYFQYGIAGGGVYDWALYDSHYTERYMDTPQTNPEGYAKTRVMNQVDLYRGDRNTSMLRLTHGTSDDNVHFQQTLQLVDAMQKEGALFELMIYPGGLHGYRGYQGMHSTREDLVFWYRYLLDQEAPADIIDGSLWNN